jgi:hypothetical protein
MAYPYKESPKEKHQYPFSSVVPWPTGMILHDDGSYKHSACPNELMREYMVDHVGRQHFEWDWDFQAPNHLRAFFVDEVAALQFKLTWS